MLRPSTVVGPGLVTYLGNQLKSRNGDVPVQNINADIIAVYFSAHWCPPCRMFTPVLAQLYLDAKRQNKSFEVVFASMDRSQADFDTYFSSMPWLAIPFANKASVQALSNIWGVRGIPNMVVVDRSGNVISRDEVQKIRGSGSNSFIARLPDATIGSRSLSIDVSSSGSLDSKNFKFIDEHMIRNRQLEKVIDEISLAESISAQKKKEAYSKLTTVYDNLLREPNVPKYRLLKKSNNTVSQIISCHPGFIQLLRNGGFRETLDVWVIPTDAYLNTEDLKEIRDHCSAFAESLAESSQNRVLQEATPESEQACPGGVCEFPKKQ